MKSTLINIVKWFTSLNNLVKVVGAIIALTVTIVGGIKAYNAYVINKHERTVTEQSKEVKLDKALIYLDSINTSIKRLNTLVVDHTEKLNVLDRKQDVMKSIMTREFAKTMTPEQVLNMMNDFEAKKNESYLNEIQLEQNQFWIPYNLK